MFAVFVVALLSWMFMIQSAPLDCENLLKPLDHPHLEGRWVLIAGSMSNREHLEKFKRRDSASITFANHSDSTKISFTRVFRFEDGCQYMKSNITLQDSSFIFEQLNFTVDVLQASCKDCAVMQFNDNSKKPVRFYLFSRNREVEPKVLEEFEAQSKCLNMTETAFMNSTKPLCPEEISIDAGAQTEEKTDGQKA